MLYGCSVAQLILPIRLAANSGFVMQVEDGQIQKMEVLGNKGAGPRALYEALGGKMPATV